MGMFQFVEPRVRRVVADHLGVGVEELRPDVSLTDELAADSLDLLELALALESMLGIEFPEVALERIRTFGDLLETVQGLLRRHPPDSAPVEPAPSYAWVRVLGPRAETATMQRAGWLTPYTAETIVEDALRAGRGARLEVTLAAAATDVIVTQLRDDFAWLRDHGVQVSVHRRLQDHAARAGLHPDVAA